MLIDVSTDCKPVNEHTIFQQVKLPPVKHFKGTAAVISMVANHNYYHWMMDILPRLDLVDQISLFARAKIIVAPHGAGLTNLVFCNPGITVLEICSPNLVLNYFKDICDQVDLNHKFLLGKGENFTSTNVDFFRQNIMVDIDALKQYIESSYYFQGNL